MSLRSLGLPFLSQLRIYSFFIICLGLKSILSVRYLFLGKFIEQTHGLEEGTRGSSFQLGNTNQMKVKFVSSLFRLISYQRLPKMRHSQFYSSASGLSPQDLILFTHK